MARRANSGLKLGQIFFGLLLLAGVMGGGWILLNHGSDPYATTPTLDVNEFRNRSASLEGNTYKLKGTVQEQLERSDAHGRLLNVTVKGDGDTPGDPVGIQIPASLDTQNIQKGQDFLFVVEVGRQGMLIASAVEKL